MKAMPDNRQFAFGDRQASSSFKGIPSFDEGEIVRKNVSEQSISLSDLRKTALSEKKKTKISPDLGGLRKVLEKTLDQASAAAAKGIEKVEQEVKKVAEEVKKVEQEIHEEQKNGNDKKIIKPGESVKF